MWTCCETTGKRAVGVLSAREEDMVDEVLGRPPVVRCRVCHKPSETGVHPECQKRNFSCTGFPDHPDELPPPHDVPPPPNPHKTALGQSVARGRQNLYMAATHLLHPRCPQCRGEGRLTRDRLTVTDCPECRPGSSKVARGRKS